MQNVINNTEKYYCSNILCYILIIWLGVINYHTTTYKYIIMSLAIDNKIENIDEL